MKRKLLSCNLKTETLVVVVVVVHSSVTTPGTVFWLLQPFFFHFYCKNSYHNDDNDHVLDQKGILVDSTYIIIKIIRKVTTLVLNKFFYKNLTFD